MSARSGQPLAREAGNFVLSSLASILRPSALTITTYAQGGRLRIEPKPGDSVMIFKDDVIYNVNK
jgi:hypothetical protein